MDQLKRFEEECQGLFNDPLDLSPPAAGAFTITYRERGDAPSAPLPPLPEIPSASGSGDIQGIHTAPASTSRQQHSAPTGSRRKSSANSRSQLPPTRNPASDEDNNDSQSDNGSQSNDDSQTGDNEETRLPTAAELKEFWEFQRKNRQGILPCLY
jgi:hypothetical protein